MQPQEECAAWDINPAVFGAGAWPMYQPMLRADFTLFDMYPCQSTTPESALDVPIVAFYGKGDRRVTEAMVHGWQRWTARSFTCSPMCGNHLWPLDREHKQAWLTAIVQELGRVLE
jgi:surfactin synthase thioesterase subunit